MLPGKNLLLKCLRPFHPPRKIKRSLHYTGRIAVTVSIDCAFHVYSDANDMFWDGLSGCGEPHSMKLWSKLCKSATLAVDVGAHAGLYSIAAAAANTRIVVHAFEPLQSNVDALFRNIQGNGYNNVNVHQMALSDYDGVASLNYDREGDAIAMLGNPKLKLTSMVQVAKLDSILNIGDEEVVTVKIDVETHEPQVLLGMNTIIRRFRPTMIIEVLNNEVGETVQTALSEAYCWLLIDESGVLRRTTAINRVSEGSTNYFLYPKERAAEWERYIEEFNIVN